LLLIHPPVSKACEPPAGVARLAGGLAARGAAPVLVDLNLEGQLHLLGRPVAADSTRTARAVRNRERYLHGLRRLATYRSPGRYRAAVEGLEHLLGIAGGLPDWQAGLANFQHRRLSPVRSRDLLEAATRPEQNPFFDHFAPRLRSLLELHSPNLAGLSVNFQHQALTAFAIAGWLRRDYPGLRLVLGGGWASSWLPLLGGRDPFGGLFDHLVAGPGEEALLRLAGLEPAGAPAWEPDYSGLPLEDYLAPGLILPYAAADGCYWGKCRFCADRPADRPYRSRPAREVAAALGRLAERYRPGCIHLLDNAISPALLRALADNPPGASWYGFARFTPDLADSEYCRALARAGCAMLQLGLESGDPEVLARMGKGIDLDEASAALENLHAAGIGTYVYLLFGTPWEDLAGARRTLAYVEARAGWIDFLNVSLFYLPRNGPEAAELATTDFSEGDLSLYCDFRHPAGWDRSRVRRFLAGEFERRPAIAAILRRTPPHFTSNHAPLLLGAR